MAIIQRDDALSRLPQTLLQMLVQKEDLAMRKEDQKLRQADFKLRSEEQTRQREMQQAALQGAQAAARFMIQRNPELQQAMQGLSPQAVPSFLEATQSFQQGALTTQGMAADVRQGNVAANVAEGTQGAMVEVGNLQPELVRTQLTEAQARTSGLLADVDRTNADTSRIQAVTRGQQLSNVYQQLANERDPTRVAQARALFESGQVTWGQAREAVGLNDGGIPDDTVYVPPEGSQQNAEALKNQGFARMMQISNGIINQLEGSGVRIGLLPSLQRQTQSATLDAAINSISSPDQRRLVNAQRMFGDAYRFSLSGQQSSDREALRMLNAVVGQTGDDDATLAQKAALRSTMAEITAAKAGGLDPVQGARMGLRAAQNTGNPETIALFEEILAQTIEQTGGGGISNTPTDGTTLPSRLDPSNLDRLINEGIRFRPGGGR